MIRLEHTSGGAVADAIADQRRRLGAPTMGMVLTLLIVADEDTQADATSAAITAARQHPMRILTLIARPESKETRLDAEIAVGGDDGPGEVAVLRLRGELAEHANSVAVPLLLPDTPVVAYWPGSAPATPAISPLGRHAQRRITDVAGTDDPLAALRERRDGYVDGDTDLAWTRLTSWRSVLAAALDQPTAAISGGSVRGEAHNPSVLLLAAWLQDRLGVRIGIDTDPAQGIAAVTLDTADGPLSLDRPDGAIATLSRPGRPSAPVALARRELSALLSEELRQLDSDEVYERTLVTAVSMLPQ